MTTLSILGNELEQALEELHSVQSVGFGPALEEYTNSKFSLTYRSAALEAEGEAKENWFNKLVAFFKKLFERIKAWFVRRKAAGVNQDIEKRVNAYKEAVTTFRENDKVDDKELDAVLNSADDKSVFIALKKQADQVVNELLKDEKFFQEANFPTTSVNLYNSLCKDKSKAKEVLATMVVAAQHLDSALDFFKKATTEVRQGRQQGRITIGLLLEHMEKCTTALNSVDETLTAMQSEENAPKNCDDVLNAMLNIAFFTQFVSTPMLKESRKISDELMKASEETMSWFENVSNQGTRNSGNELNDKIYDVGAQSVHNLAMSPAKFMMLVNKLETMESRCVPGDPTGLLRSVGQALSKAAADAVTGKTPQEKQFAKEYISQIVHNKITTYIKMSGA